MWFRRGDLRLADHAPLQAALATSGELVPLFVLEPEPFAHARRAARHVQLVLDALAELHGAIAARGSRLALVAGPGAEVVPELAVRWHVTRVAAQRSAIPAERARDDRIAAALAARGIAFELHDGQTLAPPGALRSAAGRPYTVFAQFARAFERTAEIAAPRPAPRRLPALPRDVARDLRARGAAIPTLAALGLSRDRAIVAGGERAARLRLRRFLRGPGRAYATTRDRLDLAATSRLSQDLTLGTLSPREVWIAAWRALGDTASGRAFRSELLWRELAYSTLWDQPWVQARPCRPAWRGFPVRRDRAGWRAWCDGTTGYPVVDAAARQLLAEGFVPNRARMIAASFLTKDLLLDYRLGEAHYLALLADGDPAQNNFNWQWVAGCGCEAQPFFRVLNPARQGERFDPEGAYVRRWVPELARLPARHIHAPDRAPPEVLRAAGVRLGENYPRPIVDHATARARYLAIARAHLAVGRARRRG